MAGVAARSWRWPWQPPPGMVRVSKDAHIEVLTAALRATNIEAEIRVISADADRYRRSAHAHRLVDEQTAAAGVRLPAGDAEELVADAPQFADGRLHEAAFLALLGQRLLEQEFGNQIPTTATATGDDPS